MTCDGLCTTRDTRRVAIEYSSASLTRQVTCVFSVSKYCSKMAGGGVWGGGIEMAALSHSRRVNVHVYQVIHLSASSA